jgi:hypothetical protein
MSCSLENITLPDTVSSETFSGLSFEITSSDDTKYADTLSRVRMSWKNAAGNVSLTLDSETAGQITIDTDTAYEWAFTVEPRTLSLAAGFYSWSIEVTDSADIVDKNYLTGTHRITPDPHV